MELCCYGCGREGIFEFKSKQSKFFGQKRCADTYRSCPIKSAEGGEKRKGQLHSAETKKKIGAKSKGRPSVLKGKTAATDSRILSGARHPAFGKERSLQHCENISKSLQGKQLTEEHKDAIGRGNSGQNNGMYGRSRTEEEKNKISATAKSRGSQKGERNGNYNKDLDREGLLVYRGKVIRESRKTYELYKTEINPNDFPISAHGKDGYQLDHVIPISVGFKFQIPYDIMASKENLQMLYWKDNLQKRDKVLNNCLLNKMIELSMIK